MYKIQTFYLLHYLYYFIDGDLLYILSLNRWFLL